MKTLLSPKDLAVAIGVSESTLKRWADDGLIRVSRTAGGHRRIPLPEALRFIRDIKATIVRPDILDMPELVVAQQDVWQGMPTDDGIFAALKDGNSVKARGLILSSYLSGRPIAQLLDGPVTSAMHKLGELWKHDQAGILVEHRAVDICIQAINQIRSLMPADAPDAPVTLGGAAEHDPYILPSLMSASVLSDLGYKVMNFGPHTPADVLINAASRYKPRLIWVTCSSFPVEQKFQQDMARLLTSVEIGEAHVVAGGRGCSPTSLPRHPRLQFGSSMAELSAFASGLLAR